MAKYPVPDVDRTLSQESRKRALIYAIVTNGVHVPTWLAPGRCFVSMTGIWALVGASTAARSGSGRKHRKRKCWRTLGNAPASLKSRLLDFVRMAARSSKGGPPQGESPKILQTLGKALSFRTRFDDWFCTAAFCDLQEGQPDSEGYRVAGHQMVNDPKAPCAVRLCGARRIIRTILPASRFLQQIAELHARQTISPANLYSSKTTTST